ncbi:hypothetical protein DPMN_040390 [Dreissena polymorpha]|uniref:Uncharacterized protein n=1 Tax=Dreissena polymorpha TaxID=45954 RepID=A0A9D4CUY6_DREPO|nr:hypothetical protein DPMN_040390 [Dreissena polymorpha]
MLTLHNGQRTTDDGQKAIPKAHHKHRRRYSEESREKRCSPTPGKLTKLGVQKLLQKVKVGANQPTNRPTNQQTNQQTGQKQYVPHYYSGGHKNTTYIVT